MCYNNFEVDKMKKLLKLMMILVVIILILRLLMWLIPNNQVGEIGKEYTLNLRDTIILKIIK